MAGLNHSLRQHSVFLVFLVLITFTGQASYSFGRSLEEKLPEKIELLADADYFDRLEQLISQARHRIDLAVFLFKMTDRPGNRPARIVARLIEARQRGLAVRVILEESAREDSLNQANREVASALQKGGVSVFFDSPKRVSHIKLVVIDRRYCLVGSHNLSESALKYNREFSLLVDSSQLADKILSYMDGIK